VSVQGNLSFVGNNAERSDGGALYISEFGQVKLYSGAQVEFINNTGRYRGEWRQGREEWGWYDKITCIIILYDVMQSRSAAFLCGRGWVTLSTHPEEYPP